MLKEKEQLILEALDEIRDGYIEEAVCGFESANMLTKEAHLQKTRKHSRKRGRFFLRKKELLSGTVRGSLLSGRAMGTFAACIAVVLVLGIGVRGSNGNALPEVFRGNESASADMAMNGAADTGFADQLESAEELVGAEEIAGAENSSGSVKSEAQPPDKVQSGEALPEEAQMELFTPAISTLYWENTSWQNEKIGNKNSNGTS